MARYLVVAHKTAESPELAEAVNRIARTEQGTEFTLLVPATPRSYWRPWDETESFDEAKVVAEAAARQLRATGALVTRWVAGSRDPLPAIEDELREGPRYDGLVIATLPVGSSRWLKLDLVSRARARFGLPVTHVLAQPRAMAQKEGPAGAPQADGARPGAQATAGAPAHSEAREDQVASLPISVAVPADMPPEERRLWEQVWDGDATEVFRALRPHPELLNGYIAMLQATWSLPGVEPQLRELIVLRTAQMRGSDAMWRQHAEIAVALGVSPDRVERVDRWQTSYEGEFDARDRAVLGYVEALCGKPGRVPEARDLLRDYLSEDEVLLVTLLTGFYWLSSEIAGVAEGAAVRAA